MNDGIETQPFTQQENQQWISTTLLTIENIHESENNDSLSKPTN